jgi:DNA (cytosine-5)-methyltransferase 1
MRLLDLFCSAGGAGMGYHRAGFEVVGVDIAPQPRYPFEFHQADAFEYLKEHGHEFDAIHASPECRDHTPLTSVAGTTGTGWQLSEIIGLLEHFGKPYVVENVGAARFEHNLLLCGDRNFGLRTVRHRKFRCAGFSVPQPPHPKGPHSAPTSTKKRRADWDRGYHVSVTGDVSTYVGSLAMGIDWMTGNELSQAIPPAYTEYIGGYLYNHLESGS